MNLRGRNKVDPTFNMSSMTDIVFLLLIFFMLTSTLVTLNAIDLILPSSSGKTENKAPIAVSVTQDGIFYINKRKVGANALESEILKSVGGDK
jgi:biopolymer transport protein ExbD